MPIAIQSNALVDLTLAKLYLKIPTLETSQDDIVTFWINTASDRIEQETRRKLKEQSFTEFHHGRSSNIVMLKQFPIALVPFPQVFIDNSADFGAETEVDADSIRVADDGNSLVLLDRKFPNGYQNIKVVYTAGFSVVPSDIQNACLWMITWYHKAREGGDIGRESKSKGDETISFLQKAPQDVKDTLAAYTRNECPFTSAPVRNG
jgi:hypothetical protein